MLKWHSDQSETKELHYFALHVNDTHVLCCLRPSMVDYAYDGVDLAEREKLGSTNAIHVHSLYESGSGLHQARRELQRQYFGNGVKMRHITNLRRGFGNYLRRPATAALLIMLISIGA